MQLRRIAITLAAAALAAPLTACGGPQSNDFTMPSSFDELAKEAQSEGTFTMYSSLDESVNDRLLDEFSKRYDIKGTSIYLSVAQSQVRFASEAGSGKPGADLMFGAGFEESFLKESVDNNWLQPVADWKIPGDHDANFPSDALSEAYARIDSTPMMAVYNPKALSGPVPTSWEELADPRFKGKLVLPNPNGSQVYVQQWGRLMKAYGPEFLEKVAANGPITWVTNMDAAIQAVAADQGVIGMPVVSKEVSALKEKGASVESLPLPNTTGTEMKLVLTTPDTSVHPAAARLFADWVMSKEGATILAEEDHGVAAYDEKTDLPKGYEAPQMDDIDALTKQVTDLLNAPSL